MLTLEENQWNFKAIKTYSTFNLLPIQIDMKTGKLERQLSKIKILLWRLLFSLAIAHWFFMMWRLIPSVLEPEKYFRWDHFIIHTPFLIGYFFMYYTGFCLFHKNHEESVLIVNQLFMERENFVQKMMDQVQKQKRTKQKQWKRGQRSQVWIELEPKPVSASAPDKHSDSDILVKFESKSAILGVRVRPLWTWPPQYSLDELLARLSSLIIDATNVFVIFIFALDQTRPQHFYSLLPPEFQNVCTFIGLLAIETVFWTIICVFAFFSINCQLLFFGKCQAEFKRLDLQLRNLGEKFQNLPIENRDIRRETWILRQVLREMKELAFFIELFNCCFSPCIFAFKLICLFVTILFYFFTIRHFANHPFLASFTGYVAVLLTVTYGVLYEKAFSIPEKMEDMKNKFLLAVQRSTSPPENANRSFWFEMKKEMEGIRIVGIKVGGFHTLERQSTPNFMDFVFQKVVSLLVTYT